MNSPLADTRKTPSNCSARPTSPASVNTWQPRSPWPQHTEAARAKAAKLRAVLLPFLERYETETRNVAQLEIDGRTAYAREYGHSISASGFRALLDRTVKRDRHGGVNRNAWHRLEIYLDDHKAPLTAKLPTCTAYDHAPLIDRLRFADPLKPTLTELQNLFDYAFGHFESLAAAHSGQRPAIKRSIIAAIHAAAPQLSKSAAALRRNFDRKYSQWTKGGRVPSAIFDKRTEKTAGAHLAEYKEDVDALVAEAWRHDGKLSIANQKLRHRGELSDAFTSRYKLDLRTAKSYVPRSVRREVKARLTGTLEYRRSRWAVQRSLPPNQRDWSEVAPGDLFAADDCTFNIYWKFINDKGRLDITRGEILPFMDCRSMYVLGFVMVPGHYNGETIRRGILHVHDKHGLPHLGYLFERGAWESRLLTGENGSGFLGWDEFDMGLRERGLSVELNNVTTPGGKLIEGLFNILQQNQRNERGFVGFNERDYGQERLQKLKARIKRGQGDPLDEIPWQDEWIASLSASIEYYNHQPQNGRLLRGAAPVELFTAAMQKTPLRKLNDNDRFLLATHRVKKRVEANGIAITIRGERRFYYSPELGDKWRGREVLAWYNIEQSDLLSVSDVNMKEFMTVKHELVPAYGASEEQLREAYRRRNGFGKSAKLEVDRIKHPVRASVVRDGVLPADAQALGAHVRQETERFEAAQAESSRKLAQIDRTAAALGVAVPADIVAPDRVQRGLERERRLNEKLRSEKETQQ